MATYTGNFEVQRFQLEWEPVGGTLVDEDVRVCTFHSIKLVGGAPSASWDPADFISLDNAFTTWWTAMKVWCPPSIKWSAIKAYRAGPNVLPPQIPTYESTKSVPGTSASVTSMPPQVALSVTEKAGGKKNWGRFYFPALSTGGAGGGVSTVDGRPATVVTTALADATDALYEAARIALVPFVIYHKKLEANRPTGSPPAPSSLPERPAEAVTVESIQVDDVFDIIRRRRWESVTLRTQRTISA
jgi:hypothetical protein